MAGAGAVSVEQAAEVLRAGGVVAFPTETVYGLGADALREDAVAKVFALKGRPANNPLIVHVLDEAMARRVSASWPERASRLAQVFWPGPLTIVVAKSAAVPALVTAGGQTVAVRRPDHAVAEALLRAFGGPMVGPSANPSGAVSPTTSEHVRVGFGSSAPPVLEGGACRVGIESTVVSLVGDRARVLRPGAIGAHEIAAALNEEVEESACATVGDGAPAASPGMLASHYAPKAGIEIVSIAEMPRRARELGAGGARWAALPRAASAPEGVWAERMPMVDAAYASRLYAALREADAAAGGSGGVILIEAPPEDSALWRAIHDRLRRASAARG